MGYDFTLDDVAYLRTRFGEKALLTAQSLELRPETLISDLAVLRSRYPGREAALVDTVRSRRRAAGKLRDADRLLLTDTAVQQATTRTVAAHRAADLAARFPGAVVHDVTCSIGAELAELAAEPGIGPILGSDIDRVRLAMAAHNVPTATLLAADALTPTSTADIVIADPARRTSGGSRTFRLDQLQPSLFDLFTTYAGRPLLVKSAPGLDYQLLRDRYGYTGEVQITSFDGGVREACLWTGREFDDRRRATVIRSDGTGFEITDADGDGIEPGDPGTWIIDPDGAVVRAGLVRHYAKRHDLWQLDGQIAYLTGHHVPPGDRGWRVMEWSGFSEKHLKRRLADLDCGVLEILVRGVEVDPDKLRGRLKLRGSRSLAVVVTRIGRRGVVFICEAGVRAGPAGRGA